MIQTLRNIALTIVVSLATFGCETPAVPQLSAYSIEIDEGNATKVIDFDVFLSASAAKTITLDYATNGVNADSGVDFEQAQGTLEIAKGATMASIPLTIFGDVDSEETESFLRPLARRDASTLRPAAEAIRSIKPCLLRRFLFEG